MRWVRRLVALLSVALTAVPAALYLSHLEGTLPMMAYMAGVCSHTIVILLLEALFPRRYRWIVLPLCIASFAAQLIFLPLPIAPRLLFAVPMLVCSVAITAAATAFSARVMSPQQMIGCAVVYAAAYILSYLEGMWEIHSALAIWCGVYLIWSVVLLNISATSSVAGKGSAKALRLGNMAMTLVFVLIALALVNLGAIKDGFGTLITAIARGVLWLVGLFGRSGDTAGYMPDRSGGDMMLPPVEAAEPSLFDEIVYYATLVVGILVAIALVGFLLYRVARIISALYRRLREWLNVDRGEGQDYEDEQFSLMTWRQAQSDALENIKKAVKRLTYRPPRWDSMDNRGKLRYAMEVVLYRGGKRDPDLTMTAREQAAAAPPRKGGDAAAFAGAYDRARYSSLPVTDEDAENARRFV